MFKKSLVIFILLICFQVSTNLALADQHSVDVITSVLQTPISTDAEKIAREFDDNLMVDGSDGSNRVYLVTDERSIQVNNLVAKLLVAMGENADNWVVRVLDTDEPVVNAFVTGGKYIYVFTGLMKQVASEDELAFVLSHELGHSLLKHNERRKEDISTTYAGIAKIIGAFSKKKNKQFYNDFARITVSSYSRLDEEEADAIGAAIARRAGYNSVKGADFFVRSIQKEVEAKREVEKIKQQNKEILDEAKIELDQADNLCTQATMTYNLELQKTAKKAYQVNYICQNAQSKRLAYIGMLQKSISMGSQELSASSQAQNNNLFSSHPNNQSRVATIVALTDFFSNRRDLESLVKFKQTYNVMMALSNVDSVLLKSTPSTLDEVSINKPNKTQKPANSNLTLQLEDLKAAHDKGLISNTEFEKKRLEILDFK